MEGLKQKEVIVKNTPVISNWIWQCAFSLIITWFVCVYLSRLVGYNRLFAEMQVFQHKEMPARSAGRRTTGSFILHNKYHENTTECCTRI